jgi:hypothetical protein
VVAITIDYQMAAQSERARGWSTENGRCELNCTEDYEIFRRLYMELGYVSQLSFANALARVAFTKVYDALILGA